MKTSVLLLALASTLCAQLPDLSAWEKDVEQEMARTKVPGAAIGLVRDGRLVYSKGFGLANIETGEPARPDQLFRLGSTTKMMTAAALVTLAQQKKIDLQAPIRTYIKDLPPALGALTTHQLLTHSAGIKDAASMAGSHDDEALGRYIRTWDDSWFFTQPGRVLSYSNPGYHLAGFVLESVTGKSYAAAMEEVLFRPLGMKRTTLRPLAAMTYPLAQGHNAGPMSAKPVIVRPAADDASQWPAGSVFTSVEEWSRLVIAFLGGGKLDGAQVLPEGLVAAMTKPHMPSAEEPDSAYGYGLMVGKDRGLTIWQHGGARAGYGSLLIMVPERNTAIFATCNRSGASLEPSLEKLLELVLALPAESKKQAAPLADVDSATAARLTGTYRNGALAMQVTAADGAVKIRMDGRDFTARMQGVDKLVAEKGPTFTVVKDPQGRAEFLCSGLRCGARAVE